MATFIQHPSPQGDWQDATGNKFFLLEIKDGAKVYTSSPEVTGTDEASTATSLKLTAVPNPASPKKFGLGSTGIRKISVPRSVTARQLRLALVAKGISQDSISSSIAAIPNAIEKANAQIEWEYATVFERAYPLIAQIGTALNLSSDQIDQLFIDAVKL